MMISASTSTKPTQIEYLVRYGQHHEVVRARSDDETTHSRHQEVVLKTSRGLEVGVILDVISPRSRNQDEPNDQPRAQCKLLRSLSEEDRARQQELTTQAQEQFPIWAQRILDWQLELQLLDLEWTLDQKTLILYVINDRGPECTKLALQAAIEGLGVVEVQPLSAQGAVPLERAGGCGCSSGGCGKRH